VTFDVGGNGEIVEDGASGLVVPFPDVDSLVNAGVRLLSDAPLRHRMGVSAKERFSMLTDSDVILAEWDAVFRRLTACGTDSGETG